jgi:hypothetical protein
LMGRLTRPDDATDSMTPRRRGCEGVPSGNLRPLGRRGGQLKDYQFFNGIF